ncbi:class I SAM-dependent methyltransferase [Caulobacter sp. S45]|uniref:class I SAM-dependent methyltransferase n=1 Tax=Caulobacter sp. S45 TaxID=1641861 RepID=UPI00131CA553|nr:class I SAM-dependent methyltransferase [Caulobacter sp. S45]
MIYLHIGRNKAGSTTLQNAFTDGHLELREAGVHYVNFGHLAHSDPRIEGFATAPCLAAHVRKTQETVLVSNEFMSAWDDAYTWAVAEALAGLEVRVLVYLRDYTQWLPSLYAEAVKTGSETRDFDVYADAMTPRVSAWPMLETWAAAFGWSNLRVRALDTRSLEGGDILSDALHALGVPAEWRGRFGSRQSNASPGWIALEMIRAARRSIGQEAWDGYAPAVVRLAELLPSSPTPAQPEAGYLEPERARRLADAYDLDLTNIQRCTGVEFTFPRRLKPITRRRPPCWRDVPQHAIEPLIHLAASDPSMADLVDHLVADHRGGARPARSAERLGDETAFDYPADMSAQDLIDLSAFGMEDGVRLISPPQRFDGGEETYDLHIGGALRTDLLQGGRGAWRLALNHAGRPIETLLEIGAGGGTCSLGLVGLAPGVASLLTDPSPTFLHLIQRKLQIAGLDAARTQYATLTGEDIGRLPKACFDVIVIASAMHHIADWRTFLVEAAAALRPGGVLVAQEPCREGNLMMAMAIDVALSELWPRSLRLSVMDVAKLERCRDSIYFLADSAAEKIGEDKHSFLVNQIIDAADAAGFTHSTFYSNSHFADLAHAEQLNTQGRCSLMQYLDSFLAQHHQISPNGMAKLRRGLFPILHRLDATFLAGDGAPLLGCIALRK